MGIITLTSDYGTLDYRVPAIKGSILSLNPEVNIIDITHNIDAYNLLQTSYIVKNSYSFFPKGTVHIVSVDSFYSKERRNLIYKADGHFFIAADNGILSLILNDIKPEAVYEITVNTRFDDRVGFTSTEIFAPAAVHLINGGLPEVIGRKIKNPKQIMLPRAVFNESEKILIGEVLYIDNFGNVVSNINKKFFEKCLAGYENYTIRFRNLTMNKIYSQYTDVVTNWKDEPKFHGKASAVFNGANLLELTIYKGSKHNGAKNLFGLKTGESIYVEFE